MQRGAIDQSSPLIVQLYLLSPQLPILFQAVGSLISLDQHDCSQFLLPVSYFRCLLQGNLPNISLRFFQKVQSRPSSLHSLFPTHLSSHNLPRKGRAPLVVERGGRGTGPRQRGVAVAEMGRGVLARRTVHMLNISTDTTYSDSRHYYLGIRSNHARI